MQTKVSLKYDSLRWCMMRCALILLALHCMVIITSSIGGVGIVTGTRRNQERTKKAANARRKSYQQVNVQKAHNHHHHEHANKLLLEKHRKWFLANTNKTNISSQPTINNDSQLIFQIIDNKNFSHDYAKNREEPKECLSSYPCILRHIKAFLAFTTFVAIVTIAVVASRT